MKICFKQRTWERGLINPSRKTSLPIWSDANPCGLAIPLLAQCLCAMDCTGTNARKRSNTPLMNAFNTESYALWIKI